MYAQIISVLVQRKSFLHPALYCICFKHACNMCFVHTQLQVSFFKCPNTYIFEKLLMIITPFQQLILNTRMVQNMQGLHFCCCCKIVTYIIFFLSILISIENFYLVKKPKIICRKTMPFHAAINQKSVVLFTSYEHFPLFAYNDN